MGTDQIEASLLHHTPQHSLVHVKRSCHKSKWVVGNRLYRRPALKCHLNWRTQRSITGLLYPEVYHHIISCLTWLKNPNLSMNKNTWIRGGLEVSSLQSCVGDDSQPQGFLLAQFHWSRHISLMPYLALQGHHTN